MSKAIPKLKALREAKFWTQADLHAESGVAISTISAAENGARISLGRIKKLADALDVKPEKLL